MKKLFLFLGVFLALSLSSFAQSGHSATLNWTQSTTPGVTSNKVYSSLVSSTGPYSALFTSTSPITTYTDTSQAGGSTVYYVVTALVGQQESAYSTSVTVNFPANPFAPTGLSATNVK